MKYFLVPFLLFGCSEFTDLSTTDAKCGNDADDAVDMDTDSVPEIAQMQQALMGNIGANPNPLTFWWWDTDPTLLRPAIECALDRIRATTCMPADVSFDAAHWVRHRSPEDMMGYSGRTTGSWDSVRISLSTSLTSGQQCQVLLHEMVHTLRRNNNHPGVDGSMSYPTIHVTSSPISHITAGDLALICAVQTCGCQNPEPAP
jgi:hypothetical protein